MDCRDRVAHTAPTSRKHRHATRLRFEAHEAEVLLAVQRQVHERIRWPADQPGAWHLPLDTDEDYCRQLVSEARLKKPSGRVTWVRRHKENHLLVCEAVQAAASHLIGVHRLAREAPTPPANHVLPQTSQRRSMRSSFV